MLRLLTASVCLLVLFGLALPAQAQRAYTVRSGDTLLSIARRQGASLQALRRANRLRSDMIRPGQRITIPGASRRSGHHRIRPGDTLLAIARRYGVTADALRRANRLRGDALRAGERLRIPGRGMGAVRPEGAAPAELNDAQREAAERGRQLGLGTSRIAHKLLTDPPDPAWVAAAGEDERTGDLATPVDGGVYLRGWGSGARAYHLAVDIGARTGTPVLASARGIVAYAGSAVRGYGNLIIVVHPNGWVTWYAHNHQNLVVAGQLVERGEQIGEVGSTGYARGPHVHFILQHQGLHCDALPLIQPGFQGRDGSVIGGTETRWLDEQPDEIRCAPKRSRRRR